MKAALIVEGKGCGDNCIVTDCTDCTADTHTVRPQIRCAGARREATAAAPLKSNRMKPNQGHPVRPRDTSWMWMYCRDCQPQRSYSIYGRMLLSPLKPTDTARASGLEVEMSVWRPDRRGRPLVDLHVVHKLIRLLNQDQHTHAPLARCQQTSKRTRRIISDHDSINITSSGPTFPSPV